MSKQHTIDVLKEASVRLATKQIDEKVHPGVAKGSLEGDLHMCASKIMHREWKEGTPLFGEHATPDENGHVSWYKVMFEHGIETVRADDENVEILLQSMHGSHKKKKMKEEVEQIDELNKSTLASYVGKAGRSVRTTTGLSKDFETDYYNALKGWNAAYEKGDKKKMADYDALMRTNDKLSKDFKKKAARRILGIERAGKLLAKEEVEIDEAKKPGDTVTYEKGGKKIKAKIRKHLGKQHGMDKYELDNAGIIYSQDIIEETIDEAGYKVPSNYASMVAAKKRKAAKAARTSHGKDLDTPNKKEALKKFKARKDKDIDNDGDVDNSDEYLHNRRQKIAKSMEDN